MKQLLESDLHKSLYTYALAKIFQAIGLQPVSMCIVMQHRITDSVLYCKVTDIVNARTILIPAVSDCMNSCMC